MIINALFTFFLISLNVDKTVLFNGTNLTGWKIYGTEKWYVKDKLLICESGPDKGYGYLATEKFYDNFILTLEFNQESDGNSGVFFRSNIEGIKISGWQVEVAPPGSHSGGIYESYGRGWLIQPPSEYDDVVVLNQWNFMKIKVYNNEVTTWINGIKMINIHDDKIGKGVGSIALQIHDGGNIKVKWKNINIEMLN
ncbi:MAG TPA: DUF1080 domain-containing protein [Cytophagales bacterium]|jgi:hypothetical protein|nr:DUF1080 domain-containing protein [Cytophagales bacterium]